MKNIHIILTICFFSVQTVIGQPKATDPIPESLKQMIIGYTCSAIDQFKAQLCPQFKDSIFIDNYGMPISGFSYLYHGVNSDFMYDFDIKRWPEDRPYINFFLITKKNNIMTRVRDVTDEKGRYIMKKGNV